jgi:hypothetical protein
MREMQHDYLFVSSLDCAPVRRLAGVGRQLAFRSKANPYEITDPLLAPAAARASWQWHVGIR